MLLEFLCTRSGGRVHITSLAEEITFVPINTADYDSALEILGHNLWLILYSQGKNPDDYAFLIHEVH